MDDDLDPDDLEFLKSPAIKSFRARCMYCGSRFETPGELKLHGPRRCHPKFWFWFANMHPWLLAIVALCLGFIIGRFLPG